MEYKACSPFLETPLTDFSFLLAPHIRHFPKNSLCAQLDKKFLDCLEAYGARRAREKCADVVYDMVECSKGPIQAQRAKAIRIERMRQYRAGKIDKPFEEYPPLDAYLFL